MNKPNENIVQKFYENICSDEEYKLVTEYLNSLNKKELNEFMDSHIDKLENNEIEVNISYEPNFNSILSSIKPKKNKNLKFRKNSFYSIAASIVFFIIVSTSVLYFLGTFNEPQQIKWNEKITKLGQKSIITLLDGTRITLNADSKLRYPTKFGIEKREIELEGEAYFEVSRNPDKPFIVKSGTLVTTVLGTKFNVKAYPSETDIKIALVEGKVKVTKNNKSNSEEVFLKPHQQIIYNRKKQTDKVVKFDTRKTIGWRNNVLVFENEELKDVLIILERAFGIELEIADKITLKRKISANFDDESFWGIIEVMKYLTNLDTKTIGEENELEKIIFYKK